MVDISTYYIFVTLINYTTSNDKKRWFYLFLIHFRLQWNVLKVYFDIRIMYFT